MKNKITLSLVFIAMVSLSYKFLIKDSKNKSEVSTQQEDFLPHQEITVEEVAKKNNSLDRDEKKTEEIAQEEEFKNSLRDQINDPQKISFDEKIVNDFVSKEYGISDDDLQKYKEAGFNTQSLLKAAELGKLKNLNADQIIELRNGKRGGWGRILREYNLKPAQFNVTVRNKLIKFTSKNVPAKGPPKQ